MMLNDKIYIFNQMGSSIVEENERDQDTDDMPGWLCNKVYQMQDHKYFIDLFFDLKEIQEVSSSVQGLELDWNHLFVCLKVTLKVVRAQNSDSILRSDHTTDRQRRGSQILSSAEYNNICSPLIKQRPSPQKRIRI